MLNNSIEFWKLKKRTSNCGDYFEFWKLTNLCVLWFFRPENYLQIEAAKTIKKNRNKNKNYIINSFFVQCMCWLFVDIFFVILGWLLTYFTWTMYELSASNWELGTEDTKHNSIRSQNQIIDDNLILTKYFPYSYLCKIECFCRMHKAKSLNNLSKSQSFLPKLIASQIDFNVHIAQNKEIDSTFERILFDLEYSCSYMSSNFSRTIRSIFYSC